MMHPGEGGFPEGARSAPLPDSPKGDARAGGRSPPFGGRFAAKARAFTGGNRRGMGSPLLWGREAELEVRSATPTTLRLLT
jgi:hypothetical protein